MNMNIIYYIEVNLICMIFLFMFGVQIRKRLLCLSETGIIFNHLIWAAIVLCASDMIAGIFRGMLFVPARQIIELSNMLYFESMAVVSYLWMKYVFIVTKTAPRIKKPVSFALNVPFIVLSAVIVSNPLTHILFSVDENNLYSRGKGIHLHWIVTILYLLISTAVTVRALIVEKNKLKRQELVPLFYFIIAPVISSAIQMLFYGITSTQLGITVSIVMICISVQNSQILTDGLTGLNNRRGLDIFLNDHLLHSGGAELTFIMIDINDFKKINDAFGHQTGDEALRNTANTLRDICRELSEKFFLCRYGGDEFVIAWTGDNGDKPEKTVKYINERFSDVSKQRENDYALSVSTGMAAGVCSTMEEIEQLLNEADKIMYDNKKRFKSSLCARESAQQ